VDVTKSQFPVTEGLGFRACYSASAQSCLGCTFKNWNVKETVVGQFALEYSNDHSSHTGHINDVLHNTTVANKVNHAETRTSV